MNWCLILASRQVMEINPNDTVLTLTSGGCNALNLIVHGAGQVSRGRGSAGCGGFGEHRAVSGLGGRCTRSRELLCMASSAAYVEMRLRTAERSSARAQCVRYLAVVPEWSCPCVVSLQVVSVDCNPAQSALLELKAVAIKQLEFEDVWQVGVGLDSLRTVRISNAVAAPYPTHVAMLQARWVPWPPGAAVHYLEIWHGLRKRGSWDAWQ